MPTRHKHSIVYHSQTLYDGFQRYPSYDNKLHSIAKAYKKWKNYILPKEMTLHTNCSPLPTLDNPWKLVSLDFMSCFTSNEHGNKFVFVIVDCFLRTRFLARCKKIVATKSTHKFLFEHILVHFWFQNTIFLDRYNMFLMIFWFNLWSMMDIKLNQIH